jgi:hypothetical protein
MSEDYTHHDDVTLYAGDDWTINGTLMDKDGNALDLSGEAELKPELRWVLLDPDGRPALASDAATITIVEPPSAGKVVIAVPDTATAGLAPGPYVDALRVHDSASQRSTLWSGRVLVSADLFA